MYEIIGIKCENLLFLLFLLFKLVGKLFLPQMRSFGELIVVELNQGCDGIINCGQLHQCHLPVLGEKLKCLKKENF